MRPPKPMGCGTIKNLPLLKKRQKMPNTKVAVFAGNGDIYI